MAKSDFFTIRGYERMGSGEISHAMEDYLEMIYRYAKDGKYIRVNQLASLLNVQPPSASKMAAKLKKSGMVQFEPYGMIELTERGREIGGYLLRRHEVLNSLFCLINRSGSELELVERIEHSFNIQTVSNIEIFLQNQ
jgi:Mn-dependent DtxR family transcriptional regulator